MSLAQSSEVLDPSSARGRRLVNNRRRRELNRTVTAAEYARLTTGMTYRQAVEIIGFEGEELSRSEIAGITTVMYQWTNSGLFSTANMNAMFQDGRLVTKAQFGLE